MINTGNQDIVIVGGGLVGASLALALSDGDLRVTLLEAVPPNRGGGDQRAIALAYGSRLIFEDLGVWGLIEPHAQAITHIHVSDRGRVGFTRLDAAREGVPALGYVISAKNLAAALWTALEGVADVQVLAPAKLESFDIQEQGAELRILHDQRELRLRTELIAAADGWQSPIRERLGIACHQWEYRQSAVTATVQTSLPHQGRAFERFTEDGPLALLPLTQDSMALIWTHAEQQLPAALALNDSAFLAKAQERFGFRLGRFLSITPRQAFPLRMLRARESVRERVALIGNAAHTLHPVAGQGFNLGLRDVTALAKVVLQAKAEDRDAGTLATLSTYARLRQREQDLVTLGTDAMTRIFTNPLEPLRHARNLGLLALDLTPPLRRGFARLAMGLGGGLLDNLIGPPQRLSDGLRKRQT